MTPGDRQAVAAFLDAIAAHLTIPGPGPEQDVRLACAHVAGGGCDPAELTHITLLLNGTPEPARECQACHATTGLDTVHVPAREGIAARVEFYCHSRSACYRNRHPLGAVS